MDHLPLPLVFALNGRKIEVSHVDPSTTLLTYIREHTKFKGTKRGCEEGGCGACVVLLSRYDASRKEVEEFTINSCLVLLASINHCAVTTIEGLGSSKTSLHPIQERFAGFHASQCGFCTPGMCMAVYGALRGKTDVEKSIQGNICRCTGYRPIVDVGKSFQSDVDVEDLGLNTFWRNKKEASLERLPSYDPFKDPKFPSFLIEEIEKHERMVVPTKVNQLEQDKNWLHVRSIQQVFPLLENFADRQEEVKLVVGNTSAGIYKNWNHKLFIDISKIPELHQIERIPEGIEFGAAISISKFIRTLEDLADVSEACQAVNAGLASHLNKLASIHVRNAGSIGGNLIIAQKFEFDSDLATLFLGCGASVKLQNAQAEFLQSMDEFLEREQKKTTLLKSVILPNYEDDKNMIFRFKSFRASPRPQGNAVAYVNAAFQVRLRASKDGYKGYNVEDPRLAFGAVGAEHAIRATPVEQFLKGKPLTAAVLLEAIQLLRSFLAPYAKNKRKTEYRVTVAASFLFKFFHPCIQDAEPEPSLGFSELEVDDDGVRRRPLLGRQKLQENDWHALGEPSQKIHAELQASGEAVYVADIPSDCLHAALVYSEKALARLKGIHTENALASPGAVAFFSAKDIPGRNIGIKLHTQVETLFAEDIVECAGQGLGVMVADTEKNAKAAAKKVEVHYDTESVGPPIITIEDAAAANSFFPFRPAVHTYGNASEELTKAAHKIEGAEVKTPTQYFFYMETQSVLVVPDEDDCLVVYSSSQAPEFVQATVSACIGIPMHNVRVITRRLGGGFGGKGSKACFAAAACALAAYKLQRPVRMFVDLNTDMIMMGGREAIKVKYSAGFTPDGKVTALQAEIFIQAGWSQNLSFIIPGFMLGGLKKFNWESYKFEIKLCKTNVPSRSPVRAPGKLAGSFIADAILEQVAAVLDVEAHKVMEMNMHSLETSEAFYEKRVVGGSEGFTLPMVWDNLKKSADFENRLKEVEEFNLRSLWLKRGLAMVQGTFVATIQAKPARVSIFADSSVVVEVGGVDMGQGLYTKVRQAAAYTLSQLFKEGEEGIPLQKFRVVQADSISVPNGGLTAGSTASEASCEAVRLACNILLQRLVPVKSSLEQQHNQGVSWESIVITAKGKQVDLSAQAYYVASPEVITYLTYAAGATEVEIDVLTGESRLLRADMVYDCGKSMNPAVDIGQIEGGFAQAIGFFLTEEYVIDNDGTLLSDGTWTYKPPTVDNIPRVLNIELMNSPAHHHRILSSKTSGEPPLLLASSVHCAIRHAVAAARKNMGLERDFDLDVPASPDKVRDVCGMDNLERYLKPLASNSSAI